MLLKQENITMKIQRQGNNKGDERINGEFLNTSKFKKVYVNIWAF